MSTIYVDIFVIAIAVIFIFTSLFTIFSIFGFGTPPYYFVHLESSYKRPLFKAIILESVVLAFMVTYSFFDLKGKVDNKEVVIIESRAINKDYENLLSAKNIRTDIDDCNSLGTSWFSSELNENIKIKQNGCNYTGSLETGKDENNGFNHKFSGSFTSPFRASMNIERINKNTGCSTIMFGTVQVESELTIRRTIIGTDGKCDLPVTFSNSYVYTKI